MASTRGWLLLAAGVWVTLVAAAVGFQRPGSGWILAPSADRAIKRLFWKEFNQTEVWMRLTPRRAQGDGQIPAVLIFSAILPGNITEPVKSADAPTQVTIEAHPDPRAVVTKPTLVLSTPSRRFDFFQMGRASLLPGCDGCSATAVQARVDRAAFAALSTDAPWTCEVLGFECRMEPDDVAAMRRFGAAIGFLDARALK